MRLPSFIILGAAKAGTTSVWSYLKQHPQVFMTRWKEPNFFALEGEPLDFKGPGDGDWINRFSVNDFDAYQEMFRGVDSEEAIGEASPMYLFSPKAPERIRHYLPNVKLVAILRHPVERAFSQFLMFLRDGREPHHDFALALKDEAHRISQGWEWAWQYARVGLYHEQLYRYLDHFDPSQLRVYLYHDLNTRPVALMQEIFQFIGVESSFVPNVSERLNQSRMPAHQPRPTLTREIRRHLIEFYREDVKKLEKLLKRDLSHWLKE